MNSRIRALAQQAGNLANELYQPPVRSKDPGVIWEDGHVPWNDIFQEKFAELILQECSQHLTNIGQDYAREQLERHFEIDGATTPKSRTRDLMKGVWKV